MMGDAFRHGLKPALERGLVTEAEIDRAVERVLVLKARLGLFEAPYTGAATRSRPAASGRSATSPARRRGARSCC